MSNPTSLTPLSFDVSQLPRSFGTGRLPNLLVTFDNFSRDFSSDSRRSRFPFKCESLFIIAIQRGDMQLTVNLHEVTVHAGQILTMMPGCIFEGRGMSEDVRFCGAIIDKEYMETMRKNVGLHMDLTHRYFNFIVHDLPPIAQENYFKM